MEISNPDYVYEPTRVDINTKGKIRARKVNNVQPTQVNQVNLSYFIQNFTVILIPILCLYLVLICIFLVGPLSIAVQNIGKVSILSKKRRMENYRHVDESGKQK